MEELLKNNIELAKEKLLHLLNKHKDNPELHSDLKDVFEAVSFKANDIHDCGPGRIWNGNQCVDDLPK